MRHLSRDTKYYLRHHWAISDDSNPSLFILKIVTILKIFATIIVATIGETCTNPADNLRVPQKFPLYSNIALISLRGGLNECDTLSTGIPNLLTSFQTMNSLLHSFQSVHRYVHSQLFNMDKCFHRQSNFHEVLWNPKMVFSFLY